MLRWMTPFLVAIFAIGTAAAEGPEATKTADGPAAAKPADSSCRRQVRRTPATAKPNDSPSAKPANSPAAAKRADKAAAGRRAAVRAASQLPPGLPRAALQLPDHGCPAAAPLYVRRGRALVVEEEVFVPFAPSNVVPMRRASSARRCCRAHRRCPAITEQAIPTAMTAPITAAPMTPYWNRLPYACGVYGYC